jgi:tetratricopeptide (TPR) repeat protein
MNKQNIFYTLAGLFAGFILGFFLANSINRNASMQAQPAQITSNAPLTTQSNPQTQSADIKESASTGALPEVAQTISRAENEPGNFSAQIKAGEMYLRIQNLEKATEFINRAVAARQDNFENLATLGNAYFDIGHFEEAEKWYSLALAKKPDDIEVRSDLGSTFVWRAQPDLDRAIKEYRISLEKNPRHENTLFNLSHALFRKGDLPAAQSILVQLEQVNPQSHLIPRLKERLAQPAVK